MPPLSCGISVLANACRHSWVMRAISMLFSKLGMVHNHGDNQLTWDWRVQVLP